MLFLIVLFLLSCNISTESVVSGNDINLQDRLAVKNKIVQIHTGLQQKDATRLSAMLSDDIKKKSVDYTGEIQNVVLKFDLDSQNFLRNTIMECLVTNNIFTRVNKIHSDNGRFSVIFPYKWKTYIYLFTVASSVPGEKLLVTNIFFKEKDEWKLAAFHIAPYSYNDRNAYDLYTDVSRYFYDGNHLASFIYGKLMMNALKPGGQYLSSDIEEGIQELSIDVGKELRNQVSIPVSVKDVSTHPEIFDLQVRLSGRKGYPFVLYKSAISLKDEWALIKENNKVHEVIERYIPAIKTDFDTVFYAVVNEYPNQYREVQRSEFAQSNE